MESKPTGKGRVFVRVVAILLTICCLTGPVAARGAGAQDELPAAIVEGTCDDPGGVTAVLRGLTVADGGVMTSLTTVDLAIGELTGGGYAVVAGDPAAPDACGELSGQGDDVYVAVSARADSNLGGVAWLHASDYRTRVSLFVGENLNRAPSGSPNDDGSGAPEPPADETPVPTATPRASASQPAGKTKTYTSPTFGYTVTYDAGVWEITEAGTDQLDEGPRDTVTLKAEHNVAADVVGLTVDPSIDAYSYVYVMAKRIANNEGTLQSKIRDVGGDETHAFIVIDFVFEDSFGNPNADVFHIETWKLASDDGLVTLFFSTRQDDYDQWLPARDTLAQGIALPRRS